MPLPDFLIRRYKDWRRNNFPNLKKLLKNNEKNGQKPKAMVISCCDSRVIINEIFKGKVGDFFIYKNIANLVPTFKKEGYYYPIHAALEYATKTLKIRNIVVLGHSSCGGINYAYKKFSNKKNSNNQFIDKWIINLKSVYSKLGKIKNYDNSTESFEKLSIINSINNLHQYPFLKKLILKKKLEVHGLWFNIGKGTLMIYNRKNNKFEIVED